MTDTSTPHASSTRDEPERIFLPGYPHPAWDDSGAEAEDGEDESPTAADPASRASNPEPESIRIPGLRSYERAPERREQEQRKAETQTQAEDRAATSGGEKRASRVGAGTSTGESSSKTNATPNRGETHQEVQDGSQAPRNQEGGQPGATANANESQAIGGSSTPLEDPQNPASDAAGGDSGHGGFDRLDGDDAPEEAADGAPEEESNAYLQTDLVGTTAQRRLLERWTEGCPYAAAAIGLLLHAWAMFRQRGAEFFPVYCRTMRAQLPDCPRKTKKVWQLLEERGILLVKGYSYSRGRCREFQLAPWAAMELAEAGRKGAPRAKKLLTGERHYGKSPVHRMRVTQENRNQWHWDPLTESLKALKGVRHVVNYDAAEAALEKLKEKAQAARRRHAAQPSEETEKALEEAQGRYASAQACLQVIDDQTIEELGGGLRRIRNAYEVQTVSGRLSFKGGGPQSLPRALKAALYDLPGVYNWDIVGSQTWGLRQLAKELQELGLEIDTAPLDDYLARGGKDWVVREHDLPRKLVGKVEHAAKFGAFIPESLEQAEELLERWEEDTGCEETLDVVEHVKEFYSTEEEIDRVLAIFHELFSGMMDMIREMAEALVTVYWDEHKQRGGRGMGWYMRNAAGITFNPFEYEEGHKRRTRAMAWYLQGLEAAFVHAITALSKEYDYKVLANEHDGLITRGKVPEAAIEEAREMSGFHAADFIIKPLADTDELAELGVWLEHKTNHDTKTTNPASGRPAGPGMADGSSSSASQTTESLSGAESTPASSPPNGRPGPSRRKTTPSTSPTTPTPDSRQGRAGGRPHPAQVRQRRRCVARQRTGAS